MLKLHLLCLTLWSAQAAYISRLAINNRLRPTPTSFRPGVMLRWHPRVMQGQHRPYVIYRSNPQRYAMRHFNPATRSTLPWKTTVLTQSPRLPAGNAEYEFVRAASAPNRALTDGDRGAIHTIPAPNLSLAEKPIVVMDGNSIKNGLDASKQKYEVTEKYQDPVFQVPTAKIEQPIGFSKTATITTPELQSIVGNVGNSASVQLDPNSATVQLSSEFISVTPATAQQSFEQHSVGQKIVQQPSIQQVVPQSLIPQQFTVQSFNGHANPQQLIHANSEGMIISPSALYQPDPDFLQKLQNQLLQRFPGIEFVPYVAELQAAPSQQIQVQAHPFENQVHHHVQQQSPQLVQYQLQPQSFQIQQQSQPLLHQQIQAQQQPIQPNHLQQHQIQPHHFEKQQSQQKQIESHQYQQQQTQQPPPPHPALQQLLQPQQQSQTIYSETVPVSTQSIKPPHPALQQLLQPHQQSQTIHSETVPVSTQSIKPQAFVLNHEVTKQTPSSFVLSSDSQRNVVQRETQEGVVTLLPPADSTTEKQEAKFTESQNVTGELNIGEIMNTTTVKNELTTEEQKVSPVYYAQIGQSLGGIITNGFYSAVNDVRAAAALDQTDKPKETVENATTISTTTTTQSTSSQTQSTSSTTTLNPELKPYFVQKTEKDDKNQTVTEMKPVLGTPFVKTPDSINVAYTLVRTDDKETKMAKDGSVYAGQIVEAKISEDQEFNKQQANLKSRRPPLRLVPVADKKEVTTTTTSPQKLAMVKARIPPRSKLTFDDKTGEPVLRIYASYIDTPMQKQMLASRLSNMKYGKNTSPRKPNTTDNVKTSTVNAIDKTQGFDGNQVSEFGQKLRSRSDEYIEQLFEDYEE